MAGTTLLRTPTGMPGSDLEALRLEYNKLVDDVERVRAALSDSVVLATELRTDYGALLTDVASIRTTLGGVLSGSAVIDPANLADGAGATVTITVTGAALGDFAMVSAPYDLVGITVTPYVSATNTVSARIQNESGGAVDLASGTWRARVFPQATWTGAPAAATATAIAAAAPSATAVDTAADLTAAKVATLTGTTT